MLPDKKIGCHRTGFEKTCYHCVTEHGCQLWTHVFGTDPNTGQEVNAYGCADVFRNKFIQDGAREARQMGAALEGFRNEVARAGEAMLGASDGRLRRINGHQPRLIEGQGGEDG